MLWRANNGPAVKIDPLITIMVEITPESNANLRRGQRYRFETYLKFRDTLPIYRIACSAIKVNLDLLCIRSTDNGHNFQLHTSENLPLFLQEVLQHPPQ